MGLIDKVDAARMKEDRPELRPGYTVEVAVRVIEGDKERQQKFRGEVISVRGSRLRKSFTVRKVTEGVGVERTWPLHSPAIAAASILAKVTRDRIMVHLDRVYPNYGFAHNKGYCTQQHFEAIKRHGPCPIHRYSFSPVVVQELPFE